MSELDDIWKKLSFEKLEATQITPPVQWPLHSKHPVRKLLHAFGIGLRMSAVFVLIWIYFLVVFEQIEVKIFMGLMIVGYLFFFFLNYKVFREIRRETDFSGNLLVILKTIYQKATRTLAFQRKAALFIYPVAGSAGFILGFAWDKDPERVFHDTSLLATMIIVSIVLTPIAYYVAQWVDQKAFGKYCDQLKVIIDDMEQSEEKISVGQKY